MSEKDEMMAFFKGDKARPTPAQCIYLGSDADVAVLCGEHGSGKTTALLMECTRHVDKHGFVAVIFTSSPPQVDGPGALWDKAQNIYVPLGATPRVARREWIFPSGARVLLRSLTSERSVIDYVGSAIPLLCFDNCQRIEPQLMCGVIQACNRQTAGVKPYIRCTASPDWEADQWQSFKSSMQPRTCQLYRARTSDNPHLPAEYVQQVMALQCKGEIIYQEPGTAGRAKALEEQRRTGGEIRLPRSLPKALCVSADGKMDMRTQIALAVLPGVAANPPEFVPRDGTERTGMRQVAIAKEAFRIADAFIAEASSTPQSGET